MATDILERLGDVKCDQVGFTPEHAKCICRLASEAAKEIEVLRTALGAVREAELRHPPYRVDVAPEVRKLIDDVHVGR